jgi:hypothetical protein
MGEPASEKTKENITNPLADALDANAESKPQLDYAKKVPGYPADVAEITETDPDLYSRLLPKMKEEMKKQIKGREPRHGDIIGTTIDKYAHFLLIDDNAKPKERMFKAKQETNEAKSEQAKEPVQIPEKAKDYKEVTTLPAGVLDRAIAQYKKDHKNKSMEHGSTASEYDKDNYEYYIIYDETKQGGPYRFLKSPKPIPRQAVEMISNDQLRGLIENFDTYVEMADKDVPGGIPQDAEKFYKSDQKKPMEHTSTAYVTKGNVEYCVLYDAGKKSMSNNPYRVFKPKPKQA